ncbi:unnamed protein product [Dovyalis caffra]|uniref:Uncharacterized protein n=1 Tax=Dovyalis caffra TaxID=77055 RepID=A0AAV1QY66_9ROSI|nr:unnamed protein product [Dovyalis caffra]
MQGLVLHTDRPIKQTTDEQGGGNAGREPWVLGPYKFHPNSSCHHPPRSPVHLVLLVYTGTLEVPIPSTEMLLSDKENGFIGLTGQKPTIKFSSPEAKENLHRD